MSAENQKSNETLESDKVTLLVRSDQDDLFELDYYGNGEDESIGYLRQMLKLAKKKIKSKRIDNSGKVKWARAGIEASKILLYSGVIDRSERRRARNEGNWLKETMRELLKRNSDKETSTL